MGWGVELLRCRTANDLWKVAIRRFTLFFAPLTLRASILLRPCGWGDAHVTTATAPTAAESKHHMSKGVARRYATVHAKASLSLIPHKSDFRSEVAWRKDDVDTCDTCYPVYPAGFVHFEA